MRKSDLVTLTEDDTDTDQNFLATLDVFVSDGTPICGRHNCKKRIKAGEPYVKYDGSNWHILPCYKDEIELHSE